MAEPVKTIADFLVVVRKSGLLAEARLAEVAAAWPDREVDLPPELPRALVAAELLTDWQVEQLCKGKHKGFMLGKYRLLRLLGAGGMSSVYLAWNTTLEELVAIKVLPAKRTKEQNSKGSFEDRFGQEARIANKLAHQNIARAFDRDTAGSVQFIVMEYVDGTDLHALVKDQLKEHGKGLDVRDAVEYIRQAADGLHFAHQKGLVHRDIKPANLMLDREGVIKIMDLGLALRGAGEDQDEEASLTREHNEKVLGTVDYLSPEQAKDSHLADRRSDIYALGCTFYYLLVGRAPFAQGKIAERIQAHLNKPPPNLLDERSDVPPEIVELYFRMMAKHPDARPQNAAEVADTLGVWLSAAKAKPIGAAGVPPRRRPPRRGGGTAVAAPPVFRSGPGSSSGSRRSGPVGSGSLPRPTGGDAPLRPPVAAGAGTAGKGKGKGKGTGQGTGGWLGRRRDSKPDDAANANDGQPVRKRRRAWEFAGYPLGMWLALVGGIVIAIVLGMLVYQQNVKPF